MGLLQKACMTYDFHRDLVGVKESGKEPLSPCSHATIRAEICITVNADGKFIRAEAVDKNDPKIIIPITEASSSRTGNTVAPHPLCEQLRYFMPQNQEHYAKYTAQLKAWTNSEFSHPKLRPILEYVEGQTIVTDLLDSKLIELKNGQVEKDKSIICWRVEGLGEANIGPCWTDSALFQAFDDYYQDWKKNEVPVLCMVTGEMVPAAKQHMKGVVSLHGNAKLISSNDSSNFTYRGRFTSPAETTTVGYAASQKTHNALKWLISNQSISYGGRFFVCWEPETLTLPRVDVALDDLALDDLDLDQEAQEKPKTQYAEYQQALEETLKGWKTALPSDRAQAVIAAFDAATSGRLAVTYYNELMASDFLDRLYDWDRTCCWISGKFGIRSPSVWQLASCAFGTQRGDGKAARLVVDDKLLRQQVQRLISCRIDRSRMPADIVHRLVQRTSTPQAYERHIWEGILFSACAAIRKYHCDSDQHKEEWNMALEPDKKDRSYQYGRLLAILEKAERDTYDQDEKREPNAIKMMSVYAQRPQYASRVVLERVKTAYLPRMKKPALRTFYDKLIQEVYSNLSEFDEHDLNRPLGDTYLMGYYLQRKALYTKKETEK